MKTLASLLAVIIFGIVICALSMARLSAPAAISETSAPGDTIKFYAVSTSAETRNGKTTYKVDGKSATKAEYDKYHSAYEDMTNCKPCYMRTYSKDGVLLNEGDRYTDCQVGSWKEYYTDGNIKVRGQFRTDPTGKWNDKKSDKWCSIREGEWTYYNLNGQVDSVVQYVNDVKVK